MALARGTRVALRSPLGRGPGRGGRLALLASASGCRTGAASRRESRADRKGYTVLRLNYGKAGRYAMTVWLQDKGSDLSTLLKQLQSAER